MSRFQAGIFDLDGVLCHTDQYHYQAWKAVAEQLGLHFDSEMNDSLRGVSRMASFEIILNRNNREMPQGEKPLDREEKPLLPGIAQQHDPGRSLPDGKAHARRPPEAGPSAGCGVIKQKCAPYFIPPWPKKLF